MRRKSTITIIVMLLIVIIIGCMELIDKLPINSINQISKGSNLEFSSQLAVFDTLEQVVEYADNIIVGKVVMEEDFSDTLSKYTLAVNANLKGNIDSKQIAVYEATGKLYLDKDYLLFLEKLNNPLYPEHSYTSFEKAMITEVNNGKILSDNKLYNNETDLNKITAAINNSKENFKLSNKNYEVIDELQTITDLIEESDYVIRINNIAWRCFLGLIYMASNNFCNIANHDCIDIWNY